MKIAYLDCLSGISGDMTLAALIDAGVDLEAINRGVASLGLPPCRVTTAEVKKKGFRALYLTIEHEPEHKHRHLHHIVKMIDGSILTDRQKDLAKRIFTRLGEAEAKVHGTTIEKVHFHEVGAVDSIVDIVGVAIAWDLLGVDKIVASPIPTGTGKIQIAHGICSIPAPATAELLTGIPLASVSIEAELTTPTGAAIVAVMADHFGPLPAMKIEKIGYGAGTKDLEEQPNLLRLIVGEADDFQVAEQVWVLETNLDDVSGEVVGHCCEKLRVAGALDVFLTSIQMKKNRPGVMLSVLCDAPRIEKLESIIFRETTSLGIRRWPVSRHKMQREACEVETEWGPIAGKMAWISGQPRSFSPEYDASAKVAEARGVPLVEVYEAAQKGFREGKVRRPSA